MGSKVHRVGVQALHRRWMLLRVQGGGTDAWTSGRRRKAPWNRKPDEGKDKEVKRTKDEESRRTRTAGSVGTDHTAHSDATRSPLRREGGGLNLEKEWEPLVYRCAG